MSVIIGPAFQEWASRPPASRSWFEDLPEWRRPEVVADLRERLETHYGDRFDFCISGDLRHGAMCRNCKALLVGTRDDLCVIERDMDAHVCGEVPVSSPAKDIERIRLVDEEIATAPGRFFSDEEIAAMYREAEDE